MKKSIRMVAAFVAAMSLTACTGSTNANTSEEDSLAVVTLSEGAEAEEVVNVLEKEVEAGDAPALNKAVETIQAELQEIIESGDAEKAAAYASQIKAFIDQNADKLKELDINTITLNDIIDEAVEEGKAKANEAVQDAANKANEAASKAINDAANKLKL